MATITKKENTLYIGEDFVEAVTGQPKCRGVAHVLGRTVQCYHWQSTFNCEYSATILRRTVQDEGMSIVFLTSQAI